MGSAQGHENKGNEKENTRRQEHGINVLFPMNPVNSPKKLLIWHVLEGFVNLELK